jgi:UDP-N-acetylglucosamine--N-acetylmuramyl-(pentapeptide) pyrophosphoryl-undecaprenol N-acetylglucosamine transferase
VRWIGSTGGMERELVTRSGIEFDAIQAGPVVGVGPARAVLGAGRLTWGALQALGLVIRWKPQALFVTGGYTAIPMALACWLARVPVLVYLPDIEPGSAVKMVARLAATVAVTAAESRVYFPNRHVAVTGYPVRPEVAAASRGEAQAHFHLDPARPTVTVFGGSRGARSINEALLEALDELLADCQILHITGELDWPVVKERADRLPGDRRAHYQAFAYLHEDMGLALAAADLVVSRAGASTLGEFPMLGLGAILVPYPYAWRYQRVNADYLADRGAAVRLNDEELKMKLMVTIRDLLGNPERLKAMRAAARALAAPEASRRIAEELLQLMAAHETGGKRP